MSRLVFQGVPFPAPRVHGCTNRGLVVSTLRVVTAVVYLVWMHSVGIIHFLRTLAFLYKLMLLHTLINFGGIFMTGMIVYAQWINMAKNLTTNEEINMMRYEHFWREFQTEDGRRGKRFVNPFSRDRLTNWLEFWGLVDPKKVTTQVRAASLQPPRLGPAYSPFLVHAAAHDTGHH